MPDTILDPTGQAATAEALAGMAERPASLAGLRLGLLDNTKHNAMLFLRTLGELLIAEEGMAEVSIVETKHNFSVPVDEEIIGRYQQACDVVITAIGDCGSCSAAAVADGINFERAGLPAAVIVTDAFLTTGKMMAKMQGAPDYEWVTTEHPMAVLNEEQVRQRARDVLPRIVATLTKGDAA